MESLPDMVSVDVKDPSRNPKSYHSDAQLLENAVLYDFCSHFTDVESTCTPPDPKEMKDMDENSSNSVFPHNAIDNSPVYAKIPREIYDKILSLLQERGAVKNSRYTWSPEEDEKLIALVKQHGPKKWSIIASELGTLKPAKQCRERYTNHLDPDIKKGEWSLEEDTYIVHYHQTLGSQWSKIAKLMKGRTANAIKNRWHGYLKKLSESDRQSILNNKSINFAQALQNLQNLQIMENTPKKRSNSVSSSGSTSNPSFNISIKNEGNNGQFSGQFNGQGNGQCGQCGAQCNGQCSAFSQKGFIGNVSTDSNNPPFSGLQSTFSHDHMKNNSTFQSSMHVMNMPINHGLSMESMSLMNGIEPFHPDHINADPLSSDPLSSDPLGSLHRVPMPGNEFMSDLNFDSQREYRHSNRRETRTTPFDQTDIHDFPPLSHTSLLKLNSSTDSIHDNISHSIRDSLHDSMNDDFVTQDLTFDLTGKRKRDDIFVMGKKMKIEVPPDNLDLSELYGEDDFSDSLFGENEKESSSRRGACDFDEVCAFPGSTFSLNTSFTGNGFSDGWLSPHYSSLWSPKADMSSPLGKVSQPNLSYI